MWSSGSVTSGWVSIENTSCCVPISEVKLIWYIVTMAVMMTLIFGNLSEHTHLLRYTKYQLNCHIAVAN